MLDRSQIAKVQKVALLKYMDFFNGLTPGRPPDLVYKEAEAGTDYDQTGLWCRVVRFNGSATWRFDEDATNPIMNYVLDIFDGADPVLMTVSDNEQEAFAGQAFLEVYDGVPKDKV